jgi:hypothetical protein
VKLLYSLLIYAALYGGTVETGYAPHYAEGLMEQVAHNRDMPVEACMVSSPVHPLDTWLYVYGERTGALLHCKTVDVSHPRDKARHIRTRRVVELSYESARVLCDTTRGRPDECPVIVVRLEE